MIRRLFLFANLLIFPVLAVVHASIIGTQPYSWGALKLGGHGYVTGIVAHPTAPNLVYIRTDVGGVFRWNEPSLSWIPLFESFPISDLFLFAVDGIALDPSDPNIVYAMCGDWNENFPNSGGDLLKSTDRGVTWKKTGLAKRSRSNALFDRYDGECIAVGPADSKVVLVGTRWDGLFRSSDGAASWSSIASVPKGTAGVGIRCIVFDPVRTSTVYVGVGGDGVYKSTNSGVSFEKMAGSPFNQSRMAVDQNGVLWVTAGHTEGSPTRNPLGVYAFVNNAWVNRRPGAESNKGFGGLAINPANPQNVIVSPHQWGVQGIYVSTDGGNSWTNKLQRISSTNKNYTAVFEAPWWQDDRIAVNPSQIIMDPMNPKRVWFADGVGVWRTNDITAAQVQWNSLVNGHEELILTSIISPPSGAPVLVSCLDVGGLRVPNLSQFPATAMTTKWSNGTSVAYCESDPQYVVRLFSDFDGTRGGAYSTNNGVSWTGFASWPFSDPGKIAVSATKPNNGSPTLVIVPAGQPVRRSIDNGRSWSAVSGISATSIIPDYWRLDVPVEADKVDGNLFYIFDKSRGTLYTSTNGGAQWIVKNSRFASINVYRDAVFVRTMPDKRGEVWINNGEDGLFRSVNEGADFTMIPGVEKVISFDLGKPATTGGVCPVYVFGVVLGQEGVFRSEDYGATWLKLTTSQQGFGNGKILAADRQVYGRVYVSGPPGRLGTPAGGPIIPVTVTHTRRGARGDNGPALVLLGSMSPLSRSGDNRTPMYSLQGKRLSITSKRTTALIGVASPRKPALFEDK